MSELDSGLTALKERGLQMSVDYYDDYLTQLKANGALRGVLSWIEGYSRTAVDREMIATVFVEPHERFEALAAYSDKLTAEQVAKIDDAPESALICLRFCGGPTEVLVIEEG